MPRALGSGDASAEPGGASVTWPAPRSRTRVDVLFSPAYTCPLTLAAAARHRGARPLLLRLPDDFTAVDGIRRRLLVSASVRASSAVLACSEFTRREIDPRLSRRARRASSTFPWPGRGPASAAPPRADARARLGARGPVILTVGAILNRRRLPVLLRAVSHLRRAWPRAAAGGRGRQPDPSAAGPRRPRGATLALADAVHVSGHVSDAGLAARYAAADVAVFLSEYEGFGLPALEAMGRGVPVIVSRRPALSEIFGGAALLVEPDDEDAVAAAIGQVLVTTSCAPISCARGQALAACVLLGGDRASARGACSPEPRARDERAALGRSSSRVSASWSPTTRATSSCAAWRPCWRRRSRRWT